MRTAMRNIHRHILHAIAAAVAVVLLSGCGEYQKLLKSKDPDAKYQAALRYFNEQQYMRAQTLLDDVAVYYKGTERSEDVVCQGQVHR